MTRPLPLAACLALVSALPFAAPAQEAAQPAATEPAAPAATAPATPVVPVGNPETGRLLTYTCQGCHGITGYKNAYPSFKVPLIGGQSAEYLAQALHDYQQGKRKHPTMQAQAQSFSDQDIADIAAFLSTIK
ncbi:c-type cytochrome [Pseudoxanthomonas suwonensis]|uniref:Cytochrome C n=1 Tax=Pseudoxanthomonas suwonensis TaxID=314722 RepID=A0A0E3ULG6_9GAMM|nr:c-type cytochrome [Pseudoxanthomonas suwonensis]AKC85461.1 cytochrome C [Pseudoxanthomonas suwonensis]